VTGAALLHDQRQHLPAELDSLLPLKGVSAEARASEKEEHGDHGERHTENTEKAWRKYFQPDAFLRGSP
jgi:hypothetical protein